MLATPVTGRIPSPIECGLPEKFDSWRDGQDDAVRLMLDGDKRATALCMPTGSGKSPAYVAAAVLSGKPTCIVTNSKGLQDQLMRDFNSIGMVDLRGKANYDCNMRDDYSCDEGHAARCPYKGMVACPYSQAEMRAAASSLVVTNYDKWVASRCFGQGMQHFEQVIFDEGHYIPSAVAKAMQVVLHHREIEEGLKLAFPEHPEAASIDTWREWAAVARGFADSAMLAAFRRINECGGEPKSAWVRHYNHMKNLARRLSTVASTTAKEWVVEEVEAGYQFDPIRPGKYAKSVLFLNIPRIIIVSATIRPKTMFMSGLTADEFDFHEFPSTFDAARCPIYYIPTMRVDKWADDLGMLWVLLDQIMSKRQDRKGIVQTVSYVRQQEVLERSRFAHRMLINERGEPPSSIIEQFYKMAPASGAALVSPAIGTGYDFPGDACRYNFLCKIPFEPPSKIVKAREANDPEYRGYQAMQTIVQNFGRHVRSKSDWGEGFIGDTHLQWFLPRYGHLAPRSFHQHFRQVSVVPPPMEGGQ